jgi:hypothetical protein
VGDSGLSFSLWKHLEDEGTEGILTTTLVGARAARFGRATVDRGDPHHNVGGRQGSAVWPGHSGPRWRPKFLDGPVFGARRMGVGAGLDAVERWGALGCFIYGGGG